MVPFAVRLVLWALSLLISSASVSLAQSYPDYQSTTVNDFADLLSPEAEERLDSQLSALKANSGVEMTVVTLSRQDVFAPDITFEAFATGLFNHWGIGNKNRNDGVLVLVMRSDRIMRIELGKAYERGWDRTAAKVIDRSFLPAFAEDRYSDGIEAGVTDTIDTIVTPFLGGEQALDNSIDIGGKTLLGLVIAFGAGFLALIKRDKFVRFRRCPQCGKRGLSRSRKTLRKATQRASGKGQIRTKCALCSYDDIHSYTISQRSSSSSGFGGGSSGGGGASGRW